MSTLKWEPMFSGGPALCNHVGNNIGNVIILHGGVEKKRSTEPSNAVYELNLENPSWHKIDVSGSPCLSHHASFTVTDRYLVTVGGWNGKARTSDIYVFDYLEKQWRRPHVKGFPEGGGLSSHAVLPLVGDCVLVVGREGGLRTQRKSGNAFLLKFNADLSNFVYSAVGLGTQSRSSHTISSVSGHVVIAGGRDHGLIEIHSSFKPKPVSLPCPHNLSPIIANIEKYSQPLTKEPLCMKNHVSFTANNYLFIHGGERFDGRSKDAVCDMFILRIDATKQLHWFQSCFDAPIARDSHVVIQTPNDIYIHGGCGARGIVCSELFKLSL